MKNLFLILCLLFIASCTKENFTEKKTSAITFRTDGCIPGQFTIENGIMVFPDIQQFELTMQFLNHCNQSELLAWRNSFTMMTSSKLFESFLEATCIDESQELPDSDLSTIISNFNGKISVITNIDGTKEFKPLFESFGEFVNINGMFKVGNGIVKIIGNKIISIPSGNFDKLAIATQSLQTDVSQGIFVNPTSPAPLGPNDCVAGGNSCPFALSQTNKWSDVKRQRTFWNLNAQTLVFDDLLAGPGFFVVSVQVFVTVRGESQRKTWIKWLCSSGSKAAQNLKSSGLAFTKIGTDPVVPLSWNLNLDYERICYPQHRITISNTKGGIPAGSLNLFTQVLACVERVDQTSTNKDDNKSASVFCD